MRPIAAEAAMTLFDWVGSVEGVVVVFAVAVAAVAAVAVTAVLDVAVAWLVYRVT